MKKNCKNEYPKLTRFKVWVPYFKSDDRLRVISEVFPLGNFNICFEMLTILQVLSHPLCSSANNYKV
jgi:hypothetical protein